KQYREKKRKTTNATVNLNYVMTTKGRSTRSLELLIDTQSNIHIIKDKELVTDICDSDMVIEVHGIAGSIKVTQVANLYGIGQVYYSEHANANILSFSLLNQQFEVNWNKVKN